MKENNESLANQNKYDKFMPLPPFFLEGDGPTLCRTDFDSASPLGQGSFGKVFKVRHKKTSKWYAIKVVSKPQIVSLKMEEQLKNEIQIMIIAKHPCIIQLYTYFEDASNIFLVMELADGHLYDRLKKKGKFDEHIACKYIRDATSAIAYLHSRNPIIIHRDIKPENQQIAGDTLKVADFGWSNIKDQKRVTYCGTPDYLAPEMIQESGHTEKQDVWTLGILMYELLAGKAPFTPSGGKDRREKMKKLEMNILSLKIDFPRDFPTIPRKLILKILQKTPELRPSAMEILQDEWLAKFGLKPVLTNDMVLGSKIIGENPDLISMQKNDTEKENQNSNNLKQKATLEQTDSEKYFKQKVMNKSKVTANTSTNFSTAKSAISSSNNTYKSYLQNRANSKDAARKPSSDKQKELSGLYNTVNLTTSTQNNIKQLKDSQDQFANTVNSMRNNLNPTSGVQTMRNQTRTGQSKDRNRYMSPQVKEKPSNEIKADYIDNNIDSNISKTKQIHNTPGKSNTFSHLKHCDRKSKESSSMSNIMDQVTTNTIRANSPSSNPHTSWKQGLQNSYSKILNDYSNNSNYLNKSGTFSTNVNSKTSASRNNSSKKTSSNSKKSGVYGLTNPSPKNYDQKQISFHGIQQNLSLEKSQKFEVPVNEPDIKMYKTSNIHTSSFSNNSFNNMKKNSQASVNSGLSKSNSYNNNNKHEKKISEDSIEETPNKVKISKHTPFANSNLTSNPLKKPPNSALMNQNPPSSSITPPMINNFWSDINNENTIEPGMADPHDTTIASPIKGIPYLNNSQNLNALSSSNLMNQKVNNSNSKQHSMSSKDITSNRNLKDSYDEINPNIIGKFFQIIFQGFRRLSNKNRMDL